MRVSWSWLREFVPVEAAPEDVADRLSMRAVKLERVEQLGAGISGVIVGAVVDVRPHPQADNVVLVNVDTGTDVREIVCGAHNYGPGDRVPVAMPGATLPGGMEISERAVRGITSHGMMCSARELHLSEDHSGILILPPDAPLGADVRTVLGLDDVVIEFDVTSNRPDLLSVAGIAREVAAMEGLPFRIPSPSVPEKGAAVSERAGVTVKDAKGCPRYLARVITGLRNGSSPGWMQRRLVAAGMRPISAIVDITNYVLLERGHPLHAFDLAKLDGPAIVVRRAKKGERITTLDDVERVLESDDVMICDAKRAVAVAGIMGGGDTEVSTETTDILLESAYFDPQRIAATARRLGLRTEASVRFERGADVEAVPGAADRVCELLLEICGGTVATGVLDVMARRPKPKPVRLDIARASTLIGVSIPAADMASMLGSIGMDVTSSSRTSLRVIPPSFRPDVAIEEDLVEEIARLYAYDRIPETLPTGGRTGGLTRDQRLRRLVRRVLLGTGLSEAQTLSLTSPSLPDRLGLPAEHAWRGKLTLQTPLSEEESVLRPALLPGLLLAAERNIARRVRSVALFEIGTVFAPGNDILPKEGLSVAWLMAGEMPGGWHGERGYDVFDATGVLHALTEGLGIGDLSVEPSQEVVFHPNRNGLVVLNGARIGQVGELHPRIARALDIPGRVAVGEVLLNPMLAAARESVVPEIPRFPAIERDIAVIVPDDAGAMRVESVVRDAAGALVESVQLFDVYRGAQAGEGQVSLAFRLTFRHGERTLTDDEATSAMGSVTSAVGERGWRVRE
ncbi:MAG: phenylalanine--tRNA ligase subunit beta [Actinomycetota bacterium]|nr:phenylalanine--tRNA ligase subunit beta [Actinomycetota bacterium]